MKKVSRFLSGPRYLSLGFWLAALVLLSACGAQIDSWAGLAKSEDSGVVYVAYNERLTALEVATGESLWSYPGEDDRDAKFFARPAVYNGTIYAGDYKGRLHALDNNGNPKWIFTLDDTIEVGPVSVDPDDRVIGGATVNPDLGLVYFGLGSHDVVAVDAEDGSEVWSMETEHGVWGAPLYVPAEETTGNGAGLYVVSLDQHMYSLDPETGDVRWRTDLGGAAPGGITYDAERFVGYVGTFLSELLAVDLADGTIIARYTADDWLWDSPSLAGDMLYFGDLKGNAYAVSFDGDNFTEQWKVELAGDAIRAKPLVYDDLLIFGSQDKSVYAVSRNDGVRQWSKETEGEVLGNMVSIPAGDDVDASSALAIVSTTQNKELVIAYNSLSGEVDWRYNAD